MQGRRTCNDDNRFDIFVFISSALIDDMSLGGSSTKVYFADGEFAFLCMRFAGSFFVAIVFACHYSFDWMVDKFIPGTEMAVNWLSDNWYCI